MDNATTKGNNGMKTEYKIDVLIVRTALFMAGKVQAIASAKAKADGFGREIWGNMKTVDFGKK